MTQAIPYLCVQDAASALDFYARRLAGEHRPRRR
jgi:uncharacterized glyoxalase superfamily protein PhnB